MIKLVTSAGAWLLKNPVVIALTVAVAALGIINIGLKSDVSFYQGETKAKQERIDALNRDVGTLVANQAALTGAVNSQNSAIDALATAAAQRDAKFDAVFTKLEASRTATNNAVKALLSRPTPADACTGAFELVREMAK